MSNFLNQFTKENYDRDKIKISEHDQDKVMDLEKQIEEDQSNPKKAESLVKQTKNENLKKELVQEEVLEKELKKNPVSNEPLHHDEETEIDPEYKKKRRNKIILGAVAAAILIASFTTFYIINSQVKMPDFTNLMKQEVVSWANKNKITVIYDEEYSLEMDQDFIISQSVAPNEKITKGSDLNIMVSLGANPDEKVDIPDFSKMKGSEIESWVNDYKMRYIQVEYVFSPDVEKDVFMDFKITDKGVSKDKFLRKNKGVITISKSEEVYEKNIVVSNFKGKSKDEVETWAKEKEFVSKFTFEEAYDDKIVEGTIISQSVDVGAKIAKNETISFVVSKGKAIVVPSYYSTELGTFDLVNSNGVSVTPKEYYSMTLAYGSFISQSVEAGTIINEAPDTQVFVYYSIGQPYLKGLIGQTEGDLPSYFYEFRSKGADISYGIIRRCSDEEQKGTVINPTRDNEYISTSDHITIYISSGPCSTK